MPFGSEERKQTFFHDGNSSKQTALNLRILKIEDYFNKKKTFFRKFRGIFPTDWQPKD